jgi:ubiquinone/menaquinone biosynthesis C-methylase UbiE
MKTPNQKQVWDNIAEDWSKYRSRPEKDTLPFLKEQKGNILDLGCGSGRNLIKIEQGKMWLVDFSKEMINLARKKAKKLEIPAEFKIVDSSKIPLKDNFFDAAICIGVLHCLKGKDREKTLKELYRVLKPGANAEISVWNKDSKWFKNREKETTMKWRDKGIRYLYLYEPKELYALIKATGFKILSSKQERNIRIIVQKPN